MHERWWLSCAALALAAGLELGAGAQPLPAMPAPPPCVAKRAAQADPRLAEKIAAADRAIDSGKPGAWAALADLAQYACAVTGDRLPVDAAFRRCILPAFGGKLPTGFDAPRGAPGAGAQPCCCLPVCR